MQKEQQNKLTVRCRAIILNEGKILLVKNTNADFFCMPGGNLEKGEGIKECLKREIEEELGIAPEIGKLLYVNNFTDRHGSSSIDFCFEVTNGRDYEGCENLERTHAYELSDLRWIAPEDDVKILPIKFHEDFKNGEIISDEVRFIKD